MESLQVISEQNILGKVLRVYGENENPLIMAKDVSEWIGHSDTSKMVYSVDEDEKLVRTMFVSGQRRPVWFLTENGVY